MKGNISEFNSYLVSQVVQPYLWGGQHTKLTPDNYESIITKKESDPVYRLQAISFCKALFDKGAEVLYGYDCSGLGMYWLQNLKGIYKSDMSANTLMNHCVIQEKPKTGYWVFRVSDGKATHIGYMVSDAEVIHAKGRQYGVVKEPYKSSYWHRVGKPLCMEFEPKPEPQPTKGYVKVVRKCRVRAGNGSSFRTLAIAYVGNEYPLIGKEEEAPYWYIIEYKGEKAWITSKERYTEGVEK